MCFSDQPCLTGFHSCALQLFGDTSILDQSRRLVMPALGMGQFAKLTGLLLGEGILHDCGTVSYATTAVDFLAAFGLGDLFPAAELAAFLCAAQRAFCAAAIRALPSGLRIRLGAFVGEEAVLFEPPFGRPRRFPAGSWAVPPAINCRACCHSAICSSIAASICSVCISPSRLSVTACPAPRTGITGAALGSWWCFT